MKTTRWKREEYLRVLGNALLKGHSGSECAAAVNKAFGTEDPKHSDHITSSSIAGALSRPQTWEALETMFGVSEVETMKRRRASNRAYGKPPPPVRSQTGIIFGEFPNPQRVLAPSPPKADSSPPGLTTVLTVGENQCRWPIGDPTSDEFTFCGRRCRRTYCDEHLPVSLRKNEEGRRPLASPEQLLRSLGRYL